MKKILLLTTFLLLPTLCSAGITESGVGIIYGTNHAFSFKAPSGWVLDNKSGVNQGVHAVFYPVGQTWKSAAAVAYAKATTKDDIIRDIKSFVDYTVEQFHSKGSPNYKGRFVKKINLAQDNREAYIYFYDGDKWGNFEAVGYVEEKETINFVVLNSRTKEAFEKALPKFEKLVSSYRFLTDKVIIK